MEILAKELSSLMLLSCKNIMIPYHNLKCFLFYSIYNKVKNTMKIICIHILTGEIIYGCKQSTSLLCFMRSQFLE